MSESVQATPFVLAVLAGFLVFVLVVSVLEVVLWVGQRRRVRYTKALVERNSHHCWCGLPLMGGKGGYCLEHRTGGQAAVTKQ